MLNKIEKLDYSNLFVNKMKPIGLSFPEQVISGDPQESALSILDLESSAVSLGVWRSEAGQVKFDAYPVSEICWIVDGELNLHSTDDIYTFSKGDVFFIQKGIEVTWTMSKPLTKYYIELLEY
ncbi:cupin domain-containing protein [Alteromonas oceanisediminis]|uniref:cupin domain-containing protein n=1 Tax=Alteromonas oceanisediminis TaxID=2836180 RepID=UPI001BDB5B07|nr:cupin domain-containing protein [Alteromonas oceanisediminis]MBT0585178.1 DUF861 domain-containing protein [Alteromonas oceanisediminis]